MKDVDDLRTEAARLTERGLSKGEVADELNVSRETADWLVDGRDTEEAGTDGGDVHVDWSAVGASSHRVAAVGTAMADLAVDAGGSPEVVVGVERAGVPLATAVAGELDADFATFSPRKHGWEGGSIDDLGTSFSRNFANVADRRCCVVDDVVTSGTTLTETVEAIRAEGGDLTSCAVLVDKRGIDDVDGVPVASLVGVTRVDTA
ncbi:orotate phosphoribosyltransferase-like protein [Halobacteriales archaeon SW_7_68_16]|nr:MAG: orotate phosphoribosyltransferase-like protein [Halobacteriales archaeon SW_7_68_16]